MRRIRNEQSHVICFRFATCLNVDGRDGRGRRGRTWTDGTDVDGRGRTGRTWTDGTDVDGRGRKGRARLGRTERTWTDGTDGTDVDGWDGRDGRDCGTTFCYSHNEIYDIGTEILYETCFVNNSTQKAIQEEL